MKSTPSPDRQTSGATCRDTEQIAGRSINEHAPDVPSTWRSSDPRVIPTFALGRVRFHGSIRHLHPRATRPSLNAHAYQREASRHHCISRPIDGHRAVNGKRRNIRHNSSKRGRQQSDESSSSLTRAQHGQHGQHEHREHVCEPFGGSDGNGATPGRSTLPSGASGGPLQSLNQCLKQRTPAT